MDKVRITISRENRKKLGQLRIGNESYDTAISRLFDYIEFHPEYWSGKI